MTDHPSTFHAEPAGDNRIYWDDRASVHRADDGGGLLDGMKALHRGSLAEMVAIIRSMPEGQRREYVIEKAGDRSLGPDEVMALAEREDFPG